MGPDSFRWPQSAVWASSGTAEKARSSHCLSSPGSQPELAQEWQSQASQQQERAGPMHSIFQIPALCYIIHVILSRSLGQAQIQGGEPDSASWPEEQQHCMAKGIHWGGGLEACEHVVICHTLSPASTTATSLHLSAAPSFHTCCSLWLGCSFFSFP